MMSFIFWNVISGMFVAWILEYFGFYKILKKVINSMNENFKFKIEHYYFVFIVLSLVLNTLFACEFGKIVFKLKIG